MSFAQTVDAFNAYLDKMQACRTGSAMLYWDNRTTGNKGGLRTRAKAQSILEEECFRLSVAPEMKAFLDALDAHEGELDEITAAKRRLAGKQYRDGVNVPPELVREFSEQVIQAEEVWEHAKSQNDFASFAPFLKRNIELTETIARLKKPALAGENGVYNSLLDDYEAGLTTDALDVFFAKLRARIVPLLKRVTASQKAPDRAFLKTPVPIEKQRALSYVLAELAGYDLTRGEIRETEHPFSLSFSKYDSRVTTHYYEKDFLSSAFSVLHECGHSIYEQGKGDDIAETLLDDGVSMAIHESQSRFYENIIGRSEAFWRFALPRIKPILGGAFEDVTPRQMYEAANAVRPSLIRIEADELTYALHIMVRYELEKELFRRGAASVDVMALPELWNAKYQEYLGITPPDDRQGILQDVHWAGAMFGYFPSYAQGSAYGAQMLAYMQREFDVYAEVEAGRLARITAWLNRHIHRYGSLYEPADLFRKIAGEDLNADYFADYLEKKYTALYELN
jgi:carboxypeptidase Taq